MRRGEIWWADTGAGGDRPVLVLTRDPVASSIGGVVVASLTTTIRGVLSELELGPADGIDQECVVNFDNINTLARNAFRRHQSTLSDATMDTACDRIADALGCRR